MGLGCLEATRQGLSCENSRGVYFHSMWKGQLVGAIKSYKLLAKSVVSKLNMRVFVGWVHPIQRLFLLKIWHYVAHYQ